MHETTRVSGAKSIAVLPVVVYDRARRFYSEVLGFEVEDMPGIDEGAGIVHTGEGTGIYLYQREPVEHPATQAALVVDEIEKVVEDLHSRGVAFEEYDMPNLSTEFGVAERGGTKSAWFHDSEGNVIALTEFTRAPRPGSRAEEVDVRVL